MVEVIEDSRVSAEACGALKGIHCALQARLGHDVELRNSAAGKDWCRLSVGVGDGDEVTWVSVAVFEEKARVLAGLTKGAEVYVEGRLTHERLGERARMVSSAPGSRSRHGR